MKVSVEAPGGKLPQPREFEAQQGEVAPGPSNPAPAEMKVPLEDPMPLPPPPPAPQPPVAATQAGPCCHTDYKWMPTYFGNKKKSVVEAYMLGLPLGFLGLHHFYLRRYGWGILYLFTFGFFGWGWAADLFRMPYLVHLANKRIEEGRCPHCPTEKNLCDAYVMWFPYGIFGTHHFYLGRPGWGVAYLFTVGLFGLGWLVDGFRIPRLVEHANAKTQARGGGPREKHTCTAYALGLPPIPGFLGAHHYYLGRYVFGLLYTFTLGLLGVGYLVDLCRMPLLVKAVNKNIREGDSGKKRLDDAYLLCFPLGFLGLHHFYLRRYGWGVLYLLTFGVLGVGWVIDWFRLPCLVSDYNKEVELNLLLQPDRPCPHHHVSFPPAAGPHGVDPRLQGAYPSYMSGGSSLPSCDLHSSEFPSSNIGVDNPALLEAGAQAPQPPQYSLYPGVPGYGSVMDSYPPGHHQPPSYEQATVPGTADKF